MSQKIRSLKLNSESTLCPSEPSLRSPLACSGVRAGAHPSAPSPCPVFHPLPEISPSHLSHLHTSLLNGGNGAQTSPPCREHKQRPSVPPSSFSCNPAPSHSKGRVGTLWPHLANDHSFATLRPRDAHTGLSKRPVQPWN